MSQEIKLGLPKGSLNTPGRGDTLKLLKDAGYIVRGYDSGKESTSPKIVNDPEIRGRLVRPQDAATKLKEGILDIAITGNDWVREYLVNQPNGVRLVGDLGYGRTRLVFAVANSCDYESLSDLLLALKEEKERISCWTEYPYLTAQAFMQNPVYQSIYDDEIPLIYQQGKNVGGVNERIKIDISNGATEGCIAEGADMIVDNTQTGQSLRENNLRILEEILESSAGLYAGPTCTDWKMEKALDIFENLQGAVKGKNYDDVKFNIPVSYVAKLREYLIDAGLCADEPTITKGDRFAAVNILIPKMDYPSTRMLLRRDFCASAIIRSDVSQYIR